ncbi:hypothetical protein [Sphingomonas jatrophae]|nr:hypothetical protein [Sphingomonas jatrophae]
MAKGTMDESWDKGAANRGKPAPAEGSGPVTGSGAGAGGDGAPEDFDGNEDNKLNNDGGR